METDNISSRGSCDFISKLPDPILHHILGLLNPKKAVQTCVLSKRWEHLWTFLPSLNFNFHNFRHDYDDDFVDDIAVGRFAKFVNTLLLRRKPFDLDVFCLSCEGMSLFNTLSCEGMIRYAVEHNTRVLHLSFPDSVPPCIYTCTSLEELYLNDNHASSGYTRYVKIYSSVPIVNLPNLRKLTFYRTALNSNNVKNLLSGCTILEFLRLDSCFLVDCVIVHKSLKHLAIVNCLFNKTQLVISAPNLLSFVYDENFQPPSNTTLNMPSLASSCLMIRGCLMMKYLERMTTNIELLELHFKRHLLEESTVVPLKLPIFSNLKNLTAVLVTFSCFQMVNCVLKNSPNLEKLTLLQEGASTNVSTNVSSTIAIFPNKKLKIVEVKYWKYNQMIRQLEDALKDVYKGIENSEDFIGPSSGNIRVELSF
ncbi:F-box protein At5g03100-like [Carex rostrata]